jgi:hypothetical protein
MEIFMGKANSKIIKIITFIKESFKWEKNKEKES